MILLERILPSVLCITIGFSLAANSLANNALTVAVPQEGYPPYIIVNKKEVSGILIDTLKLASKNAHLELEFVFYPEKRSQALLDSHDIDVRMESPGWVDNPERYLWSEPITSIKDRLIYHRLTPNVFERDDTMEGAIIVTHLGYSYPTLEQYFESNFLIRKDFTTEYAMLLNLIREQQRDVRAAVMDQYVVGYLMDKTPKFKSELVMSKRHIDYKYLHFQFYRSESMVRLVSRLNLEIKKLKRIGAVDKIIKQTLNQ